MIIPGSSLHCVGDTILYNGRLAVYKHSGSHLPPDWHRPISFFGRGTHVPLEPSGKEGGFGEPRPRPIVLRRNDRQKVRHPILTSSTSRQTLLRVLSIYHELSTGLFVFRLQCRVETDSTTINPRVGRSKRIRQRSSSTGGRS